MLPALRSATAVTIGLLLAGCSSSFSADHAAEKYPPPEPAAGVTVTDDRATEVVVTVETPDESNQVRQVATATMHIDHLPDGECVAQTHLWDTSTRFFEHDQTLQAGSGATTSVVGYDSRRGVSAEQVTSDQDSGGQADSGVAWIPPTTQLGWAVLVGPMAPCDVARDLDLLFDANGDFRSSQVAQQLAVHHDVVHTVKMARSIDRPFTEEHFAGVTDNAAGLTPVEDRISGSLVRDDQGRPMRVVATPQSPQPQVRLTIEVTYGTAPAVDTTVADAFDATDVAEHLNMIP